MKKQPNVLFMACDDLRPLIGCYGHEEMQTPNLDRLAASGVLFERNFSQVPICMASRASFMTSQRPDKHRIYSCEPVGKLMPDVPTINRHFADAGYKVLGTGKIYHYDSDNRDQFADGYLSTQCKAFGRGYLTEASQEMIELNSREREGRGLGPEVPGNGRGPCTEVGPLPEEDYPDGATAARAIEALNELKDTEEPFFLGVGWLKPHLPFVAPQKYWDLYPAVNIPFPENNQMPADMPSFSANYNYGELRNYYDVPYEGAFSKELDLKLLRGYRACVSFMDAQVGKVLDALEANGLAEDTVVVFVVDHGFQLREHDLFCKHTAFQESYHVPMFIRAPGITCADGRIQGISENIDLFPTLCELCGLHAPEKTDGQSRVEWLRNPKAGGKEAAFCVWAVEKMGDPQQAIIGFTVVTDLYRYTEWTRQADGEVLSRELFDLKQDAGETCNLAVDQNFHAVMQDLSRLISNWKSGSD